VGPKANLDVMVKKKYPIRGHLDYGHAASIWRLKMEPSTT